METKTVKTPEIIGLLHSRNHKDIRVQVKYNGITSDYEDRYHFIILKRSGNLLDPWSYAAEGDCLLSKTYDEQHNHYNGNLHTLGCSVYGNSVSSLQKEIKIVPIGLNILKDKLFAYHKQHFAAFDKWVIMLAEQRLALDQRSKSYQALCDADHETYGEDSYAENSVIRPYNYYHPDVDFLRNYPDIAEGLGIVANNGKLYLPGCFNVNEYLLHIAVIGPEP